MTRHVRTMTIASVFVLMGLAPRLHCGGAGCRPIGLSRGQRRDRAARERRASGFVADGKQ